MSRLMSVALTRDAVLERRKTVTRRLGWDHAAEAMPLTLCTKVMGRRRPDGTVEPLERLAEVVVVSVRKERLDAITAAEVLLEGFDDMTPAEFVEFFCQAMNCGPGRLVNRIEWVYLDPDPGGCE